MAVGEQKDHEEQRCHGEDRGRVPNRGHGVDAGERAGRRDQPPEGVLLGKDRVREEDANHRQQPADRVPGHAASDQTAHARVDHRGQEDDGERNVTPCPEDRVVERQQHGAGDDLDQRQGPQRPGDRPRGSRRYAHTPPQPRIVPRGSRPGKGGGRMGEGRFLS